ncbi:MAG: T9SS type A sorting domain-containing protein [Muribaculaceae bacterium]|nr:T9SS type A sorting domain-containing protein [Muribaculaceae bacterium]
MNVLRSLLASAAVVCTAAVAMAFPTITVTYPTPGLTIDDVQYFSSMNVTCSGATVNADKKPYMMSESGDEVKASDYKDFMGAILIKFDETQFKENGKWTLFFPAGALTAGGENNATTAVATFTLKDPSLETGGEWPEITLISSDPANNQKVASFGESTINKVKFVTSDDDAVNYIGWTIWDVTAGEDKDANGNYVNAIYLRQGNDNRYDFNRYQDKEDHWKNGLFVNINGEPLYLVDGHKYKMELIFSGIGYDVATNQYPRPDQIQMSKELETAIYFQGLTRATEYSPYVVETVSPDPDVYSIDDESMANFTITYSGPVKPTAFTYPLGQGVGTANAGTYKAVGETDTNGYSNVWEFTINSSALSAAVGRLHVNVRASDADGLPVKGNGGYEDGLNDYDYSMDWTTELGNPGVVATLPANNAEVDELSRIIVTNSEAGVMSYSYAASSPATISDKVGNTVRTLGVPTQYDDYSMVWEFEPITTPGEYALMIPKYYFNVGQESSASSTKSATFVYTVKDNTPSTVSYDHIPTSVTPENGATVESISSVNVKFNKTTYYNMEAGVSATLYSIDGTTRTQVATAAGVDNDFFNPTEYTFTFSPAISEAGNYEFVIAQGALYDSTYDENQGAMGHACPELVYVYTIAGGGEDPTEKGEIVPTVTPENGAVVSKLETVSLKFDEPVVYGWENPDRYKATLYKVEAAGNVQVAQVSPEPDAWFGTTEFTYTFNVTEDGTYNFVLGKGAIDNANGDKTTPELNYFFTVQGGTSTSEAVADLQYAAVDPADNSTLTSLSSIKLTFAEVAYCDFIKGTYVEVYKVDGENETRYCTAAGIENNFTAPTEYTFSLTADVAWADENNTSFTNGNYKVVFPEGLVFDAEYKSSNGTKGHYNPAYTLTYVLGNTEGISAIFGENAALDIYSVNGMVVKNNGNAEDFNALPAGLYIVNGQKIIKK